MSWVLYIIINPSSLFYIIHTYLLFQKIKSAYLNMEISLRSDQLVGWQNSQWEENLVGLQKQGFVSNIEAVTPIKQFGFLPPLSLCLCLSLPPSLSLSLPCLFMCFIYHRMPVTHFNVTKAASTWYQMSQMTPPSSLSFISYWRDAVNTFRSESNLWHWQTNYDHAASVTHPTAWYW